MRKNPFKRIFSWFLNHGLFEVLKWVLRYLWLAYGGAIVIIMVGFWTLIKQNTPVIIGCGIIGFGIICGLIILFLNGRPILKILSPVDGDEVGFEHIVRIFSSRHVLFQLLIFSGDKLWHLQKKSPSIEGSLYSVKCQFGDKGNPRPENNLKGEHIIQAIEGSEVKGDVIKDLPKGVLKSKPVHVYRKIQTIRIMTPLDKASVPINTLVTGMISDSNTAVWVIIHPKDSLHFYVYPKVNGIKVEKNGTWGTLVPIRWEESPRPVTGRVLKDIYSVNGDVGKHFQIMAVANPEEKLGKIDRLTRWPRAEYESEIIEVVRE